MLLRRVKILWGARTVVDDDLGLQLADHGIQLLRTPSLRRVGPAAVVPEDIDLAIVAAQLADLRVHIVDQFLPAVRVFFGSLEIGWIAPVEERVVKAHPHPATMAGLHVCSHQITLGRRLGGRELGHLAVKERKAIVVASREHHVAHVGLFGQPHPGIGIIFLWCEFGRQRSVFLVGDVLLVHHPLAPGRDRVDSPMDEHAIARVMPPLHSITTRHDLPPFMVCLADS